MDGELADELRALQDPVITQCCYEIDRMFSSVQPEHTSNAPQSVEDALRGHYCPPRPLSTIDLSLLNEFQRVFVERHLFMCCLEACGLANRAIGSVQPSDIERVTTMLAQCGYGLDFYVDEQQYLNYRVYAFEDDEETEKTVY
jgi:hypothetical protein